MNAIAAVAILATLGIPSVVQATPSANTGRITFIGTVLKGACRVSQQQASLQVTCPEQKTETVDFDLLAKQSNQRLATSRVSYKWVDSGHTIAIVTVHHE